MKDDWAQALQDATAESADVVPKDCITIYELAHRIDKSIEMASRKMRLLVKTGNAEPAGTFRINTGNRLYPVQHYRLKKKK